MDFVLEERRIMIGTVRSQDNSIRHLNFTASEDLTAPAACPQQTLLLRLRRALGGLKLRCNRVLWQGLPGLQASG